MNALTEFLNQTSSIIGTVKEGGIIILCISPVFFIIFVVSLLKRYKHQVILRKKTKGNTDIIIEAKFAIIKKNGEPQHIKTLQKRLELPLPPMKAIEIRENGSYFCEGYISETGQISWIDVDSKSVIKQQEYTDPNSNQKVNLNYEKIEDIELKEINTRDQSFYYDRLKKRERFKTNNLWTFLNNNAGLIFIIIVFLLFLTFWEDIMKPVVATAEKIELITEKQGQITERLDMIINDKQVIKSAPKQGAP